ncbi:MAG: enoyl-CoA hydratase [Gammaproteobacteria bacterium]|jgi:enoyl-CoA hydratase
MAQSDEPRIELSVCNHVGWLEFSRLPVNAFDHQMVQEVIDGLAQFEGDRSVRVIVLASAIPRYFSAGAQLDTFVGIGGQGMAVWCDMVHTIVRAIRESKKPMLAAINGTAVGGGLEMTLHCDVRFAADDARMGQPEVNINFIPPVGATQALVRLIGRSNALRYLYDGVLLGAEQAAQWGLIDEVVPAAELRTAVRQYAQSLTEKPPEALAGIRRAIIEGGSLTFDQGLRVERAVAIELAETENFQEGVNAFLAKREPKWRR